MADKNIIEIILAAKDNASAALKDFKKAVEDVSTAGGSQGSIFTSLMGTINRYKGLVLAVAAAIGTSALVLNIREAVNTTVELAKEVDKLQELTGMTSEASSELIAVAGKAEVSFNTLQTGVVALTRKMGGLKDVHDLVAAASGQSTNVFEKFGIQVKNTDGTMKSFSEVFGQIRTKIQEASTQTEKLAIATQFFRGASADLMPLLVMTDAQYKEIAEDARKYGLILTQDNVSAVRQYVFAQRDMEDAIQGAKLALGKELIPTLTEAVKWVTENIAQIKDYAKSLGGFLVESVKGATVAFNLLKAAAFSVGGAMLEVFAAWKYLTGQLNDAKIAHAAALEQFDKAEQASNTAKTAYASLGEKVKKVSEEHKAAAEEIKKTIPTYEEWYKSVIKGSQDYIDIKKKEIQTLEANAAYEKALLAQALADKTISQEQYLAKTKALLADELKARLDIINMEIELVKQSGESKYKELAALEEQKKQILLKARADEVKAEQDAQKEIAKAHQDGFTEWKALQELRLNTMKANIELQTALDDAAVKAGVLRESTAMQNKLDLTRAFFAEQISIAAETASKQAEIYGTDSTEYQKALAEKEKLQQEYEIAAISSEVAIAEAKKKEFLEAENFIADILEDSFRKEETQRQEKLNQLHKYYAQGLISAEDYHDALMKLEKEFTSEFKRELQERTQQLNQMVNIIHDRTNKMWAAVSGFMKQGYDDIRKYFGDAKDALAADITDVRNEITNFLRAVNSGTYNTFWSATLFGRRMVEMVGTSIYEWAGRVAEYIQYVKGLMASLQETLDGYRLQLAQLRGDTTLELEMWYAKEKKALEDKYKDDLGKTQEYYEAMSLLDELYAEKKKKAAEEAAKDEQRIRQESEDRARDAAGGGSPAGITGGGFPTLEDFKNRILENLTLDLGDMSAPAMQIQQVAVEKKEITGNFTFDVPALDRENARRYIKETFYPEFQAFMRLKGIEI